MLPQNLKKYFWEVDTDSLEIEGNAEYIISRILEYGDREAVSWLLKNFKPALIKKILRESRFFSRRTANFWRLLFNMDKNKILCLRRFYQKKQGNVWPY